MLKCRYLYLVVDTSVYSLPLGCYSSLSEIARVYSLPYNTVYQCFYRKGINKTYSFKIERVVYVD